MFQQAVQFLSLLFLLAVPGSQLKAQAFELDSTFQPFLDIRAETSAAVFAIYENPPDGRIYVGGRFSIANASKHYDGIVCYNRNGSAFLPASFPLGGGGSALIGEIKRISDTAFFVRSSLSVGVIIDTLGRLNFPVSNWRINVLNSVRCSGTGTPLVFPDGSALFGNSRDNTGKPCIIIVPPDTFPGRHIVKVNSQGLWDSSFVGIADHQPEGFYPYDSNRIMVFGSANRFRYYNGVKVDGLCRIYTDGRLDTTFTSPLLDTSLFSMGIPFLVEEDGGFFLNGGPILLKGESKYRGLVRLNADGSLDTNFMNSSGPEDTRASVIPCIHGMAKTEDGGYLVGGLFNRYQGYKRNCIAKIDSSGKLDTNYFKTGGPDSAYNNRIYGINEILRAEHGGYYVGGNFLKWDGKASQPIVRLHDMSVSVGVEENMVKNKAENIKLYPNPTHERLTVESASEVLSYEIYNIHGRLIRSSPTAWSAKNKFQLSLAGLPAALYIISFQSINGELISKKVLKQ